MKRDRKLNIPFFEVDDAPGPDGVYSAREPDVPQPSVQREQEGRRDQWTAARRAADQATADAAKSGDLSAQLKHASRQAGLDLMSSLRRSGIAREGVTPKQQREKLTTAQQAHASQMVMNCLRPLRGGLSAAGILETVGLSTTMMLLSPQFRDQVGSRLSDVYDAVTNRIANKGVGRAQEKELGAIQKGGSRDDLSRKWIRRLEGSERLARHGLAPLTAESAALMEVGIAENAYLEMRAPGALAWKVAKQHDAALRELHTMAQRDGINSVEISQRMRDIVATRLPSEPHLAQVFSELGHGRFVQGDDGRMHDPSTGAIVDGGSFSVRKPLTNAEHQAAMRNVFARDMGTALDSSEQATEAQMYVFAAGAFTQPYPEVVDEVVDPSLRRRMGVCRGAFAAMRDDGVDAASARLLYHSALLEAIDLTSQSLPAFAERWNGPEGIEWRERLVDQLRGLDNPAETAHSKTEPEANENADSRREPSVDRDEHIVDADIVETDFPDVGDFVAPAYSDPEEAHGALLEAMSTFMGDDIEVAARVAGGSDMAGNTWMLRSVYSSPAQSLGEDAVRAQDPDARQRELAMMAMRQEMSRLNMSAAQQDQLFAASYVRGLEKVVLAMPNYECVVRQGAASPASSWQEVEFAHVAARTGTFDSSQGYGVFVSACGLDPAYFEPPLDAVDGAPMTFGQTYQPQAQSSRTPSMDFGVGVARSDQALVIRDQNQKRRQVRLMQGRMNRLQNDEDDPNPPSDLDVDDQFSLIN